MAEIEAGKNIVKQKQLRIEGVVEERKNEVAKLMRELEAKTQEIKNLSKIKEKLEKNIIVCE